MTIERYHNALPERKPTPPARRRNPYKEQLVPTGGQPSERDQGNPGLLIGTSTAAPILTTRRDLNYYIETPDEDDSFEVPDVESNTTGEQDRDLSPAEQIRSLVGDAVLLDVRRGAKAPSQLGWQKFQLSDMTQEYLAGLTNNIGVSLGAASGGLFTIDCDDDAHFEELLAANPDFEATLQSHGARGGNFWLRIEGEAPRTGFIKDADGNAIGEWRGKGNQTVLHGKHPSGSHYRHNGKAAISMPFEAINWPNSWKLPRADRGEVPNVPSGQTKEHHATDKSKVSPKVVGVMLKSIPSGPDYATWLKISAAVRNSLGNNATAIQMLKEWSPEEEVGEYQRLLSSSLFGEIGYGTLFHHAKEHGFSGVTRLFYYNGKTFYMEAGREFIPLGSESAVKQHMEQLGVPKAHHAKMLCDIREHQYMHHIGPLAGHQTGLHTFQGTRVLVTTAPTIISGKEGGGCFLDRFFADLLADENYPEQLPSFLNWVAHCRRAVKRGRRTQSPAAALTGSKGDGKSLAIAIINKCLGGRSAKAYRYLSGGTQFNAELAGVELLTVDDDASSKDHRSRLHLAQSIKANQFAANVSIEGKNRDAITLDPVQTIVFAVNDDPEHLRVLPELDDNMRDKILLLKTKPAVLPEALGGREDVIGAAVDEALPGFLFGLDSRDLSGAHDVRGRLRCFWHPEIVEAIGALSPEQQLRELVYQLREVQDKIAEEGRWVGTAANLQGLLTGPGSMHYHVARNLLSWPAACGVYMARLASAPDSGVTQAALDERGIRLYVIAGSCGGNLAVESEDVAL